MTDRKTHTKVDQTSYDVSVWLLDLSQTFSIKENQKAKSYLTQNCDISWIVQGLNADLSGASLSKWELLILQVPSSH